MPDDRIDDQDVVTELIRRHTSADPAVRATIGRVATGLLRKVHAGASDPVTDSVKSLLGVDERDQMGQRTVDWYLEGLRDNPPFPERPQMRPFIEGALEARTGQAPTDDVVEVLVNVLVGVERDVLLAPSPAGRVIIGRSLVDAFAMGA